MIDIEKLKNEGKLVVRGFGTFRLLPSRKGVVGTNFGGPREPKYPKRVSFKPSHSLREKICRE